VTGPRARPRLWHHDYLHLRPLARDLRERIGAVAGQGDLPRVLDLGCGESPYRSFFGGSVERYVRLDLDPAVSPDLVGRAEALPFAGGTFDGLLSAQVLLLVDDPAAVVREIRRVTRPGARIWVSCHGAWPHSSPRSENRFGEPDLHRLFAPLGPVEVIPQGGLLGLPPALVNVAIRELVRAAERRLGPAMRILRLPAAGAYILLNGIGRLLERLAAGGPLRAFLGYLDRSMPMNYLVVAVNRK
jgi:SAM-dependent methyltransferase